MSERQPSSRSCFVCGRDNPAGLKMRWVSDRAAGEARSSVTLPEHLHGFPGIAHGGILTAILDEAVVRAVLVEGGFDDLMVTAKLEVVFVRPTPTGTPLAVSGRVVRRSSTRAHASAELRIAGGPITARAEALLTRPPPEVATAWATEWPFWRVEEE